MAEHFLSREHVVNNFSANNSPALTVESGDFIRLETRDCYNGVITNESELTKAIPVEEMNPATGPIFVKGAEPGDTLAVKIIEITTGTRGIARLYPGNGQLHDKVKAPYGTFFDVTKDIVTMNEKVSFPASPMLGVIGVAPESGSVLTMPAGRHGGNLDNNVNKAGSTIYLPVKHQGALLAIGDMHAAMGDGETGGTGVEIEGEVFIQVDVIKGVGTSYPVTETADSWFTHGVIDLDIAAAGKIAVEEAAGLLVSQWGFTWEDAAIFISVACDLGIAQAVHPSKGSVIAKVRVPKIAACPAPFKI